MCGSSMGMVFCPADYSSNSGAGFSLLFKSWVIHDPPSYARACLAVFALGTARQLLVGLRALLLPPPSLPHPARREASLLGGVGGEPALWLLGADAALFGAALLLAYLNMLVAMAYDAGLLLSLVAGEALTYFAVRVAARKRAAGAARLLEEDCH